MASNSGDDQVVPPAQADDVFSAEALKPSDLAAEAEAELAQPPTVPPPAPVREDQVENAIKFLSHPKVKGSPVKYRRAFLERKGLTAEEIDEAFSRVPDPETGSAGVEATTSGPVPIASSPPAPVTRPAPPSKPWEKPAGSPLPAAQHALPGGAQLVVPGQQYVLQPVQAAPAAQKGSFGLGQMALALAVVGGAGAGGAVLGQAYAVPWIRSLLRRFLLDKEGGEGAGGSSGGGPAEEAAAAAAAAASAMSAIARELVQARQDEKERGEALLGAMRDTRDVLASVKDALTAAPPPAPLSAADVRRELRAFAAGAPASSSRRAGSGGSAEEPGKRAPPPQVRLQSLLDDVKGLLPLLPPAAQQGPPPAAAGFVPPSFAKAAPVPARQVYSAGRGSGTPSRGASPGFAATPAPPPPAPPDSEKASYAEVLEMVAKGQRPPGIRDIDDKPPNPNQPLSDPRMASRSKPWERSPQAPLHARPSSTSPSPSAAHFGAAGGAGIPWWQQQQQRSGGVLNQPPLSSQPGGATPAEAHESKPVGGQEGMPSAGRCLAGPGAGSSSTECRGGVVQRAGPGESLSGGGPWGSGQEGTLSGEKRRNPGSAAAVLPKASSPEAPSAAAAGLRGDESLIGAAPMSGGMGEEPAVASGGGGAVSYLPEAGAANHPGGTAGEGQLRGGSGSEGEWQRLGDHAGPYLEKGVNGGGVVEEGEARADTSGNSHLEAFEGGDAEEIAVARGSAVE